MRPTRLLQALIEEELNTTVERILNQPAETMLSATRLDPDLSAEIFLLRREGRGQLGTSANLSAGNGTHALISALLTG